MTRSSAIIRFALLALFLPLFLGADASTELSTGNDQPALLGADAQQPRNQFIV